ncbi:hypothetical protein GPJ56_002583 [Histomonas meleagridis]|uniref:uncharacterized protein n=1 Tax=Histomonas meleagridis TaxID=135588 RepID=UPI00355A92B8|nr:hypothetical protein GPJ56_002583 [Histomonas meleagridis]KAH0801375.1 hypothetical protein GO595_005970 [Histomonas meleagridis]
MCSNSNIENDIEQHLNWMQSLLNGPAPGSSQDVNSSYESQIDDLIASIQAPVESRQPRFSEVCQQYTNLAKQAYQQNEDQSHLAEVQEDTRQYRISDPIDDSEDESDCEEYYVEDAEKIRGQEIPDWARAANLLVELQKQQSVDPDKIFTNFDNTCDLSAMFEKKKRTFKVRGDSGWWAADGLTRAEEINYKKAVGLA